MSNARARARVKLRAWPATRDTMNNPKKEKKKKKNETKKERTEGTRKCSAKIITTGEPGVEYF